MHPGPHNEPQPVVVRGFPVDERHAARGLWLREIPEFLGITAGEIRIVIGLELFADP
jgi:hypothetical protein